MPVRLLQFVLRLLDGLAHLLPGRGRRAPAHIATGRAGEEAAYFHLRRQGYVIVARNQRSRRSRGEIDLIGWDEGVLCFVEVKTRTTRDVKPAEAAVDEPKRRELSIMARDYLRRSAGAAQQTPVPYRFDIVSVYYEAEKSIPQINLFKNAFSMT